MDVQVLIGVVIVHIHRDIHIYPAQLIHQRHKALEVDVEVVVDGHAQSLGDLFGQQLRSAVPQSSVDFAVAAPVPVHHGVAGDREHTHLLGLGVIAGHDDGVSVSAALIAAQQQEVINAFLPFQRTGPGHLRCLTPGLSLFFLLGLSGRWGGDLGSRLFYRRRRDEKVPAAYAPTTKTASTATKV